MTAHDNQTEPPSGPAHHPHCRVHNTDPDLHASEKRAPARNDPVPAGCRRCVPADYCCACADCRCVSAGCHCHCVQAGPFLLAVVGFRWDDLSPAASGPDGDGGGVGAAGGTTDHVMTRCDPSMTRRRVCLLPMGVVTKVVVVVVILFVTVCLAGRSPGRMMVWSLQ